jgi:site-specific recombinase XerC
VTRPRPCVRCGINPVAYIGRECCYRCVPRVWKRPACCKRCGSSEDYYTAGLCRRCHRSGPWIDSCTDCFAWGVTRHHQWLCEACRGWRRKYQPGRCPSCRRQVPINERGYCRLCCRIATLDGQRHQTVDVVAANRGGQQLFFADMILKKRKPLGVAPALGGAPPRVPRLGSLPLGHRQLVLFDWPHDLEIVRARGAVEVPLPELAALLEAAVADHGARHGWKPHMKTWANRGIRILLATQDTPGAPIRATDVLRLAGLAGCTAQPVLEVLAEAGMLDDDRDPPLEAWFAIQTAGLPDTMTDELRQWFHALRDGSTTAPRTRPRNINTVRHRVAAVLNPAIIWAEAGHVSLREITRDEVVTALPEVAHKRKQVLDSLRSLFQFLKGRRLIFINPTARMRAERAQGNFPLPMDLTVLRDALSSDQPARAALASLVAFHALSTSQLQSLKLTDIRDGRIHLSGRTIILAEPVRHLVGRWLQERRCRWPTTANPHLFVSSYTAARTGAVSRPWITTTNAVPVQAIREDRILHEALASGGDIRRLCALFGLSVGGAERYAHTAEPGTG